MTRPSYDPMRASAPRFPRHRFEAAGLDEAAVAALAEQYEGMEYGERVRFFRDASRLPNEELARRYAGGGDAGANPAMLSPEDLAHQHKAAELQAAAKNAGLPAGGTKVEVATRLVEAGATGELPVITPEQVAADAPQDPPQPPPVPDAPAEEPAATAPDASPVPPTPAPETPAEPASAPEAPAEPAPAPEAPAAPSEPAAATTAPETPPTAPDPLAPDATEPPAAPADGTTTPDGGQPA